MKKIVSLLSAAITLACIAQAQNAAVDHSGPRDTQWLATGWKFQLGDAPDAQRPEFDDAGWQAVSVPHDWAIAGPFDKSNGVPRNDFTQWVVWRKDGAQAYLPRGIGWYRLVFEKPALPTGKKALLYFEGAYRESDVWLNGAPLGHHASGYTSFFYDVTAHLKPGRNVLAVRCDARLKEGWWYEACGLYRPVELRITDKLAIPPWGVWVTTPEINANKATVRVRTTLENGQATPREATLQTRIVDNKGVEIGRAVTTQTFAPGQGLEVTQEIAVPEPRLWSPDEPYLYRAQSQVMVDKVMVDATETTFGIRTFHFDPQCGFFLNGKPLKLWGAANHMDVAALGGALPPRVCFENTKVLKGSGANFLRGAHNPRTPAELDAADRLGVCVAEETRYFDNSEFGLASLRDMIRRDRNHPSILIWSLGNEEEGKQGTPAGVAIAQDMIRVVREADPYRATSLAQNRNFSQPNGFSDMFDVLGYNWRNMDDTFEDHRRFPHRAVYISEYNYDGSWDRYASWSWLAGATCWGGFEYYGEGSWPDKSWPGQIADLCHEPQDKYHRARAQWGRAPMVWAANTWTGQPGQKVELRGFSNCEEVDVFVDDQCVKSVANNRKNCLRDQTCPPAPQPDGDTGPQYVSSANAAFSVSLPFVPKSMVRLEGKNGGKTVARHQFHALGEPERLVLQSEALALRSDGMDTALLRCGIADANGNILRGADRKVRLTVRGAGVFAGSGSSKRDLTQAGPVTLPEAITSNGLCQFAVRAALSSGNVTARVEADGLQPAELSLPVTAQADPLTISEQPAGERLPGAASPEGFELRSLEISATNIAAGEPVEARTVLANIASAYPAEVTVALDEQTPHLERFSVPLGQERQVAIPLPSFYAEGAHRIVVKVSRNGHTLAERVFSVAVRPTPAKMEAEKLVVTPYAAEGAAVQVMALVRNVGSRAVSDYAVPVLVEGRTVATPKVSLSPGATAEITATFPAPAGERHEVAVAGTTGTLTILQPFKPGVGIELVGSPAQVQGQTAHALKFSGVKEYIRITTPPDLSEKSFTILLRCKLDAPDATSGEAPLFCGGRPAEGLGMRGGFHNNKVYFSIWGAKNLESAHPVEVGKWQDLAFVLETKYMPKQTGPDGADLQPAYWTARNRLYINGKLEGEAESRVYRGDLSRIAAFWDATKTFNGVIEEMKVFTTAIGAEQIRQWPADPGAVPDKPALWLNFK